MCTVFEFNLVGLLQALAPGGNFSCIWQTQPGMCMLSHDFHVMYHVMCHVMCLHVDSRPIGEHGKATFKLQYKPLIADQVMGIYT